MDYLILIVITFLDKYEVIKLGLKSCLIFIFFGDFVSFVSELFSRGEHLRDFLESGPGDQEMHLKIVLYIYLWWPFC